MPHHGEGGAGGFDHFERWRGIIGDNRVTGNINPTVGRVYLRPFQIPTIRTLDRLAYYCGDANGDVIMGVYADNGDTPLGGAVVVENVAVPCVLGSQEIVIADTQLDEGLYWEALEFSDALASFGSPGWAIYWQTVANTTLRRYFYARALGFGPLTDPCPALTLMAGSPTPVMGMRVASCP